MEVVDLLLISFIVLDFSPLSLAYSMILKELLLVFGGLSHKVKMICLVLLASLKIRENDGISLDIGGEEGSL